MASGTQLISRNFGAIIKDYANRGGFRLLVPSFLVFLWSLVYQALGAYFGSTATGVVPNVLEGLAAFVIASVLRALLLPHIHRILFTLPYGDTDAMKHTLQAAREVFAQGVIATAVTFLSFFLFPYFWTPLTRGVSITAVDAYLMMCSSMFLGAITFLFVGLYFRKDEVWIRGTVLQSPLRARYRSWSLTRLDENAFPWGGRYYPNSAAPTGFAVVGAPRTGKTLLIRLLVQCIAQLVFIRKNYRMLMLDVKKEAFSILSGIGIDVSVERGDVRTLDPDDARAWVWDLSRDFRTSEAINEFALLIVPPEGKDEFWERSSRAIVGGIIRAWTLQGLAWELRDLVAAMRSLDRVRAVLRTQADTEFLIEKIISEAEELGKQTGAMDATLWSYIAPFQDIATAWHNILAALPPEKRKTRLLSITDWATNPNGYIVLLGTGARGSPKDRLVQMVIKRLGQLFRDHLEDSTTARTWIILDEIRIAGKLDVETLLAVGGGRGASVVVGFQDKEGLDDEYREGIANEMLGLCQNKVFLGLSTGPTSEWAAGEVGKHEVERAGQRKEEDVFMSSQFMEERYFPRPTPDKKVGVTLVAKSAFLGTYKYYITGRKLWKMLKPYGSAKGHLRRVPVVDGVPVLEPFPDWTEDDFKRCTTPEQGASAPSPSVKPAERQKVDQERPSRKDEMRRRAEARLKAQPNETREGPQEELEL